MANHAQHSSNGNGVHVRVHFCIPDDQEHLLPARRRNPEVLPPHVPIPRAGEVVYLTRTSAWGVSMVIHKWETPKRLRVELWLVHASGSDRPTGFALTQ